MSLQGSPGDPNSWAPLAMDAVSDPFFLLDRSFCLRYANNAAAEYAGVRRGELIGRPVWELFGGRRDATVEEGLRRAMAEHAQVELDDFDPRGARWHRLRIYPVDSGGLAVLAVANTERKRAEQATAALAAASALLTGLDDAPAKLASIAQLAVPHIADWCTVDILATDGELRRVAVAHQDPCKVELAREIELRYPPSAASRGIAEVLQSGESLLHPEITDEGLQEFAVDGEHLEMLRHLGLRSAMLVPLSARGHVLGIMVFVSAESGRIYNAADLRLAEELAHRAALALDNARLYTLSRRVIQSCPIGILVGERDGAIRDVNEAFANLVGWSRHDLLAGDISWRELTAPEFRHLDAWPGECSSGWPLVEKDYVRRDGSRLPALAGSTRLAAGGEQVITFVLDVAERHHADRELARLGRRQREAQVGWFDAERRARAGAEAASRAKDEFVALLSHELREPLAPILAAVELMLAEPRGGGGGGKGSAAAASGARREVEALRRSRLETVDRQARRLTHLVDDLLDISRIESGKLELRRETLDLGELARRAAEDCQPLLASRSHRLSLDLPTRPLPVDADAGRIEQLIVNLLANAIKYSEPGGDIELAVRAEVAPPGTAAAGAQGDAAAAGGGEEAGGSWAVVRVRDSGIGIPKPALAHVFDPFYQGAAARGRTGGGSLGLGLTLVKRLVELHGGGVKAISEGLGRGTELVVRLPLAVPAPAGSPPAGKEAAAGAKAGGAGSSGRRRAARRAAGPRSAEGARRGRRVMRVLVVDDEADAASTLADLLRLWGHRVECAADAAGALAAAERFRPQAVLLDVGLPDFDGYELGRRLAARGRRGPAPLLIAVTGYGQPRDRELARHAGIEHHFVKPIDSQALRQLLAGAPRATAPKEEGAAPSGG